MKLLRTDKQVAMNALCTAIGKSADHIWTQHYFSTIHNYRTSVHYSASFAMAYHSPLNMSILAGQLTFHPWCR